MKAIWATVILLFSVGVIGTLFWLGVEHPLAFKITGGTLFLFGAWLCIYSSLDD